MVKGVLEECRHFFSEFSFRLSSSKKVKQWGIKLNKTIILYTVYENKEMK